MYYWNLFSFSPQRTLLKKCPHAELFWSAFFRIRTEYGETLRISSYLVRVRGNRDENNSEYGHLSRSGKLHSQHIYSASLRIQSECGKMRTRITPNTGTFHTVVTWCKLFLTQKETPTWMCFYYCPQKFNIKICMTIPLPTSVFWVFSSSPHPFPGDLLFDWSFDISRNTNLSYKGNLVFHSPIHLIMRKLV